MSSVKPYGRGLIVYAAVLGALYTILGLIEFGCGLCDIFMETAPELQWWIPIDVFGGFSAVVIGLTYLSSLRRSEGMYESLSYLLVATILSVVFGALYVLVTLSNGISSYMAGEEWNWVIDVSRPEIWLFLMSIPLAYKAWSKARRVQRPEPDLKDEIHH